MNRNKKVNTFIKTLAAKKVTIAFAESMTCGLASHFLSTCKGTSQVLLGTVVCYTSEVKTNLLGVSPALLKKYTAESKEASEALAVNLKKKIDADVCIAITGLAAPGGSETRTKPVGSVFYCVLYKRKKHNLRKVFKGTPLEIREQACLYIYDEVLNIIEK